MIRSGADVFVTLAVGALLAGGAQIAVAQVVVENVLPTGAAAFAGVLPGDRLVSWRQTNPSGPMEGAFTSPLDAYATESLWGWRSAVTIRLSRAAGDVVLTIPPGDWRLSVRPDFDAPDLGRWLEIRSAIEAGDAATAIAAGLAWRDQLASGGRSTDAVWLAGGLARVMLTLDRFDDAFEIAVNPLGNETPDVSAVDRISLLERHGVAAVPNRPGGDLQRALSAAVGLERLGGESLRLAKLLLHLAAAKGRFGDADGAHELLLEAERLAARYGPASLVAAKVQHNLGTVHLIASRNDEAARYLDRAIAFYRTLEGPAIDTLAGALSNRGIVAFRQGRFSSASAYYAQSLEFTRRVYPGTAVEAKALNNLANVLMRQGDYRGARRHLIDALIINRQLEPSGLSVTRNLSNLATIDAALGNVDAALRAREQIVENYRKQAPDGPELAFSYQALGALHEHAGRNEIAIDLLKSATDQMARVAPESEIYAEIAAHYAAAMLRTGYLEQAGAIIDAAVSILERLAPDSLRHGLALAVRAEVAHAEGRLASARDDYETAMRIADREAGGSGDAADLFYRRGVLAADEGQLQVASEMYAAALQRLERQRVQLPAGDGHERFLSDRYRYIFEANVRLLVNNGAIADALEVTERYRARSLLARLGRGRADQPTQAVQASLTTAQRALAEARLARDAARDSVSANSAELAVSQLTIELAAMEDTAQAAVAAGKIDVTTRFDAGEFQRSMGIGTLAVSYFIVNDELLIFSVSRDQPPGVAISPLAAAEVASEARRFRLLLSRGKHDARVAAPLIRSAARLYDALLRPVLIEADGIDRLMLVADGELQALPFAALVTGVGDRPRYLVEDKALVSVQSLAIFSELETRESDRPGDTFVGFGAVRASDGADKQRSSTESGLPGARQELNAIAATFGDNGTAVFSGDAATKANVATHSVSARYLHFATHAEVDIAQPLKSYLRLTPTASGDGRLELGDVLSTMRLQADLVTLSACETALGRTVASEGLMSLARAFQLAGARDVVASLWKVPDQATSVLMTSFYDGLAGGLGTPEALRAAQMQLLREPLPERASGGSLFARLRDRLSRRPRVDARHPYYWAAFQLLGPGS